MTAIRRRSICSLGRQNCCCNTTTLHQDLLKRPSFHAICSSCRMHLQLRHHHHQSLRYHHHPPYALGDNVLPYTCSRSSSSSYELGLHLYDLPNTLAQSAENQKSKEVCINTIFTHIWVRTHLDIFSRLVYFKVLPDCLGGNIFHNRVLLLICHLSRNLWWAQPMRPR